MSKELLQSLAVIQSVNWVVIPALFLWIAFGVSFWESIGFLVVWMIADWIWNGVSEWLIKGAGAIGFSQQDAIKMELEAIVPTRMAIMMMVDLVVTLAIPWIVAGYFLQWF